TQTWPGRSRRRSINGSPPDPTNWRRLEAESEKILAAHFADAIDRDTPLIGAIRRQGTSPHPCQAWDYV
ncbi:MAG: hypothetical protein QM673_11550, partial [Gordonia sp. (in: high G+C Gram-positive bacteria)]